MAKEATAAVLAPRKRLRGYEQFGTAPGWKGKDTRVKTKAVETIPSDSQPTTEKLQEPAVTEPNEKRFSETSRPKTCSWTGPTGLGLCHHSAARTVPHVVMIAGDKKVGDGELSASKDSQRSSE